MKPLKIRFFHLFASITCMMNLLVFRQLRKIHDLSFQDTSGDHTESPGQEKMLRDVLLDAIRNNKKSTSDKDSQEKRKDVIENLIELSLPPQQKTGNNDVEMSDENAEKSNEERAVEEAVANLTPQVVLNRLKDNEARKFTNVENEDQRLSEAAKQKLVDAISRPDKDIDSHQNNDGDTAEKEVNLEEAGDQNVTEDHDEQVVEEDEGETITENNVETEKEASEESDANETVVEKPTESKRGRPKKVVSEEPTEKADSAKETETESESEKPSKRGRPKKSSKEVDEADKLAVDTQEEATEKADSAKETETESESEKPSKRGRPKKSSKEVDETDKLAVDTQEEATEKEVATAAKVQSKEPRGKSPPSNNDDSAWEDLPQEQSQPAAVEPVVPVPKSIKRVKKNAKFNKLRAISTPNKNESHLQANITFMDRSEADISAIPVLSPPTVKKNTKSKTQIQPVNEASFQ